MKKTRMDYNDVSRLYKKFKFFWLMTSFLLTLWIIIFYETFSFADIYGGSEYMKIVHIAKLSWSEVKPLGASGQYRQLMSNFILIDLIIWASATGLILLYDKLTIKIIYIPLSIAIYLIKFACFITAFIMLVIIPANAPGLNVDAWRLLLFDFIILMAIPVIELIIFFIITMKRTIG